MYKIIGSDNATIRVAAEEIVRGCDYTITPSNISRTGRYHSLTLEVLVDNDEQRTGIYDTLKKHPAVKIIL